VRLTEALGERLPQVLMREMCSSQDRPSVQAAATMRCAAMFVHASDEYPWPANNTADSILSTATVWLKGLLTKQSGHVYDPGMRRVHPFGVINIIEDALVVGGGPDTDCSQALCSEPAVVERLKALQDDSSAHGSAARQLLAVSSTCSICMCDIGYGEACAPIKSQATHSWRKQGCNCMFCKDCMRQYVESKINDHRVEHIPCPTVGCSATLFESEVKASCSTEMFARFLELRSVDHAARLKEFAKDNMEWLQEHACPCPRCSVIIDKNQGCNTMVCVCGHEFSWSQAMREHKAKLVHTPAPDKEEIGAAGRPLPAQSGGLFGGSARGGGGLFGGVSTMPSAPFT